MLLAVVTRLSQYFPVCIWAVSFRDGPCYGDAVISWEGGGGGTVSLFVPR